MARAAEAGGAGGAARGQDELDFLGSRQRSAPRDPRISREKLLGVVRAALSLDRSTGREFHDQGTVLVELYMEHADTALGFRSFRLFLEKHWPLGLTSAYERMRIARLCTAEQAAKYGASACVLGLRAMAALEITSFAEFQRTPLRLHADDGGGVVHFPAPAAALRSVLRALATVDEPERGANVGETLRRYRAAVDSLQAGDPAIAALRPVVWADAKGAYVRVTAGSAVEAAAAARLYQKLARAAR
jgi:hypothetical protein